jgi:ABC-2 family transporter protein
MIWLTWRQFRAQGLVAAAALAALAVILVITGLRLAHLYGVSGIPACHAHGDCAALVNNFTSAVRANATDTVLSDLGIGLLLVTPAIIGVFWGAPLITREIETGTFRLAWNQSVTRTRWLAVKLGLIGLASMATAGLLSLMVTWWASPIDHVTGLPAGRNGTPAFDRFAPVLFAARGITPIGYAAFAFALGVTAGVLIRRTVPAMAATLAVFAAVAIVMPLWIRPHLVAPAHVSTALTSVSIDEWSTGGNGSHMSVGGTVNLPGAWVISKQALTPAGQVFTGPAPRTCMSSSSTGSACLASLSRLRLRQQVTYQPASRYWAFQWYETAIFVMLALALAGLCAWWIRRRVL